VGNILAEDKIELQSKAQVEGDITTKNLIIEEGALFHGTCNMKGTSSDSALSKAQAAAQTPLSRA
jgi:cytoskeletal protein CcmA (bactofilin family)